MIKEGTFSVEFNTQIASATFHMRLRGEDAAFSAAGQFADLALEGRFLRRPFAALQWDKDGFEIIYKVVGEGTQMMSSILPGASINALTGLGNGFDPSKCRSKALVVAGGVGASPVFSLVKALRKEGKQVCVVLGFNTGSEAILADEYRSLGAVVHLSTMDGSLGVKGLVTDALKEAAPQFDFFYCCGPKVMMKALCDTLPAAKGEVSLEERMGCGCGICYGCTCRTKNGPRRICADGPVFDREEVIWE